MVSVSVALDSKSSQKILKNGTIGNSYSRIVYLVLAGISMTASLFHSLGFS